MSTNYKQINISAETLQSKVGNIGNVDQLVTAHKDNLVNAVNEMAEAYNEVTSVTISPSSGTLSFTGKKVQVQVQGESVVDEYSLDENGHTVLMVTKNKTYTITYPSFDGYITPDAETLTAELRHRTITKQYTAYADVATSIVVEESGTPNTWTKGGNTSEIDSIIGQDGSYVIDEVNKKYAKLDASDGMKFADGTAWDGTWGNAFRHIPGCYFAETTNANGRTVLWMSRTNLKSKTFDDMWIGTYKGNVHDGKLWSQPNRAATGNNKIETFFAYAQAQSTDYGLTNYFDQRYLVALHLMKFGTPAVETLVQAPSYGAAGNMGIGMQNGGSSYYNATTGCTSGLGDGTGEAAYDTTVNQNKLFGIEGLTGQQWEFRPNIRKINGQYKMVVYKGNQVSNTIGEGHADYVRTIDMMTASGYPKEMVIGADFDVIGKTSGGSTSTYWTDYLYTAETGEVVLFGGSSNSGARCGLGYSDSSCAFGYSDSDYGARLSFRGDISDYTLVTGAQLAALHQ